MGSVRYFGLWPRPVLDPESNLVCPFSGGPSTQDKEQPLDGIEINDGVYFIWKVKQWNVDIEFTLNLEWEFIFDDPLIENATGTLSIDRSDSAIMSASSEFSELISEEKEIPCGFSRWESSDGNAILIPQIYDNGIGIDFNYANFSNEYTISNDTSVSGGVIAQHPISTPITFNSASFGSNFSLRFVPIPQELEDLFSSLGAGLGQITGSSLVGTLAISEEETWAY